MQHPGEIRSLFPLLVRNPDLAWLDNAATTQKPAVVIDAVSGFYENDNANIHRGLYEVAVRATSGYEAVRSIVAGFIGAQDESAIVYTSGATAGINSVARCFLQPQLKPGDEVLVSAMEHHANLIPWQIACQQVGAALRIIPMNQDGVLDLEAFRSMLSEKTVMVALTHISNSLGTINPIADIIKLSHQAGARVLVDAAQSIAYYPLDVTAMDVDFLVFSSHKLFGPTGIGVLYGKPQLLEQMQPPAYGGDMIRSVTYTNSTFADSPRRFEAGTPNIAGVIGLGAAVKFVQNLDRHQILDYLKELTIYAEQQLLEVPGLNIIGKASQKSAIVSFSVEGVHPHDIATALGAVQIAVRAGHHCTQPVMDHWGIPGTTRASFSIYSTRSEVDRLVNGVQEAVQFFL